MIIKSCQKSAGRLDSPERFCDGGGVRLEQPRRDKSPHGVQTLAVVVAAAAAAAVDDSAETDRLPRLMK